MISVFIFTSNDFRPWKIEEREREKARRSPCRSKNTTWSHQSKTIASLRSFKPTLVEPSHRSSRSSHHFRTTRKERDRESREIVALRTHSHRRTPTNSLAPTNPLAPIRSRSRLKFLWFWFFTFSLWSLILLLLLWWRGWWCFGGFPVVWWWVLWGWWWKIAFSECYQTHEIIF